MSRIHFTEQPLIARHRTALHGALAASLMALVLGAGCEFFIPDNPQSVPRDGLPGGWPDPPDDPSPVSASLTRAPYLQAVTENSVLVVFHSADSITPRVEYGSDLTYGASVQGNRGTVHAVQLSGLSAGRRYYYRIMVGDSTLAAGADFFFETDAGRSDTQLSFFVTGDVGEPGGDQEITGNRILQTTPRSEFGLVCGDVVYPDGEAEGYDPYLMTPWAPLMRSVAVMPALGNHDWRVDPDQNFTEQWYLPNNEHYYSFDRGNAHFIALDTRNGNIWDLDNQVAWLRADLEAHRDATWTVVYYHHPGYTCTYKGYESAVIDNFHPVFDEYGVDVVFMGHAHTYERLYPMRGANPVNQDQDPNYVDPDGTLYIVTGCGAKLNSGTTEDCDINAFFMDQTISFTHVQVDGHQLLIRQIESANGAVRDEVTITKASR